MRWLTAKRLLIALLLLAVVGASVWLRRSTEREAAEAARAHEPDYFMRHITLTALGDQGEPRHRVQASYLAHYPDDGTTEFQQPRITVFRARQASWTLHAQQGTLAADGETLHLDGQVMVTNPLADPREAIHVYTDHVVLDLRQQRALTAAPVSATYGPGGSMQAVGMEVDLAADRVVLNSQVRFVYDPTI